MEEKDAINHNRSHPKLFYPDFTLGRGGMTSKYTSVTFKTIFRFLSYPSVWDTFLWLLLPFFKLYYSSIYNYDGKFNSNKG